MKFIFIFLMTVAISAVSQTSQDNSTPVDKMPTIVRDASGLIWVLDSFYIYNWDSSAYSLTTLVRFERDQWGNATQRVTYSWDETTQTEQLQSRENYTYNANGSLLSRNYQEWDNISSNWTNITQFIYVLDGAGNRLSELIQFGNGTGWENDYEYTYTYDANNNKLTTLLRFWDNTINTWVNEFHYFLSYNAANLETERIRKDWNSQSSSWVNYEKINRVYDSNNYQIESTSERWDTTMAVWANFSSTLITNDANGNPLQITYRIWDSGNSFWQNSQQSVYNWDANDNRLLYQVSSWDTTQNTWFGNYRRQYTYDMNDNRLTDLYEIWNGSTWVNFNIGGYTYDANNNLTEYTFDLWDLNANSWVSNFKYVYFWNQISVTDNVVDLQGSHLQVYPNPVKDLLFIEGMETDHQEIEIYTLSGQHVQTTMLVGGQLFIPQLEQGIYVIRLKDKGVFRTIKFVKK